MPEEKSKRFNELVPREMLANHERIAISLPPGNDPLGIDDGVRQIAYVAAARRPASVSD